MSTSAMDQGVRAGYWSSFPKLSAADIGRKKSNFSHIFFAFAIPNPTTHLVEIPEDETGRLHELVTEKRRCPPPFKTILAIGGAKHPTDPTIDLSKTFSEMASQQDSRATFIESAIKVAREYEFDGIDLDWEFPQDNTQMTNLGLLFSECRAKLEQEANCNTAQAQLILTAAVYYAPFIEFDGPGRKYPVKVISESLDWINLMNYDYYNSKWKKFTALHSALSDPDKGPNTKDGLISWNKEGMPAKKIVLGLPLYGQRWSLVDQNDNTVGSPATDVHPLARQKPYSEVRALISDKNAKEVFDEERGACYCYSGNTWISYDNEKSIASKVKYARNMKLHGYFFWALGQDKEFTLPEKASATWSGCMS